MSNTSWSILLGFELKGFELCAWRKIDEKFIVFFEFQSQNFVFFPALYSTHREGEFNSSLEK